MSSGKKTKKQLYIGRLEKTPIHELLQTLYGTQGCERKEEEARVEEQNGSE